MSSSESSYKYSDPLVEKERILSTSRVLYLKWLLKYGQVCCLLYVYVIKCTFDNNEDPRFCKLSALIPGSMTQMMPLISLNKANIPKSKFSSISKWQTYISKYCKRMKIGYCNMTLSLLYYQRSTLIDYIDLKEHILWFLTRSNTFSFLFYMNSHH